MSLAKKCPFCKASYSNGACIIRHVRKWHPEKIHEYIKMLDEGKA